MGKEHDAMLVVRADLSDRLDMLRATSARASAAELMAPVEALRRLAATYGLAPVERVAEALQHALAGDDGSRRAHGAALYFDRLQDAIGCERLDEQASQALIAAVSVRLHG